MNILLLEGGIVLKDGFEEKGAKSDTRQKHPKNDRIQTKKTATTQNGQTAANHQRPHQILQTQPQSSPSTAQKNEKQVIEEGEEQDEFGRVGEEVGGLEMEEGEGVGGF